jgi:hypothetical protein
MARPAAAAPAPPKGTGGPGAINPGGGADGGMLMPKGKGP